MAWHTTCDWVNCKAYFTVVGFEYFAELFDGVLRLCDSHAVTGNDNHISSSFENVVGIFNRDRLHLASAAAARGLHGGTKAGKEHVDQGSIHRLTHDHGEDEARGTDQATCDDQYVVGDHKARRAGGEAGARVE